MSKLNRKKKQIYVLSLLLVSLLALNACGDDLSVRVPVLSYKDIEETVGSENQNNGENRESGGNQKDSVNQEGSESGENLQGGENQTGSADRLESQESSEPQKPEPVTITISAAGDASLGNHQGQDYYFSFRQEYDKAENAGYFLENVYDIFSKDDMTILNLEGTLTYSEKLREGQTFCIKGDPEYAKILTYGSVEAVGMANNHRLDYL